MWSIPVFDRFYDEVKVRKSSVILHATQIASHSDAVHFARLYRAGAEPRLVISLKFAFRLVERFVL